MNLKEILRDYTRNENPIYSNEIFNRMLNEWPNKEKITVYRGMNFSKKEDYDDFIKNIKKNNGYISIAAPGFSQSYETAYEFAISQKTYFPTQEIMKEEEKRRLLKETISGYCGVMLSIEIEEGSAIDVDLSGEGIESEVLLRPNFVYNCQIEKIKSLKDLINDKNFDINQYILEKGNIGEKITDYIVENKINSLEKQSREILFKRYIENYIKNKQGFFKDESILLNENYLTAFIVNSGIFGDDDYKIRFFVPDLKKFNINNIIKDDEIELIKDIADDIMEDVLNIHLDYRDKYKIDYEALNSITPYISEDYRKLYQRAISYKKNENYNSINEKLSNLYKDKSLSTNKKNQLIKDEVENLRCFIQNIVNDIPKSLENVKKEKIEKSKRKRRLLNNK